MQKWIAVGMALCLPASAAAAGADRAASIRDAAARNLALFQSSQKHWFEVQRCDSCHHQYQPALAYRAAREHGIPFDESIARADAARAFTYADLDKNVQYSWVLEPAVDDAFRLIAADAAGVRPNVSTAVVAKVLTARQNRGGDWPSHRQRPPSSYSNFTFTALGVRAIQLYAHPTQKADVAQHVALARRWFESHTPVDTEERTYKLLGLKWSGGSRASRAAAARDLAKTQEADGGWASLDGRASDAYSTGQALVALHDGGGMSITDANWQRGIEWLLKTQAADGSWRTATPLFLAAYSGNAEVLRDLLNAGASLNGEMTLIGTSNSDAISGAVRHAYLDVAETLVKLGAPVDRTDARITPLVKAVVGDQVEMARFLISKGADVNHVDGNGMTPLLYAASIDFGSPAMIDMLLKAGARTDMKTKEGKTALELARQYHHTHLIPSLEHVA